MTRYRDCVSEDPFDLASLVNRILSYQCQIKNRKPPNKSRQVQSRQVHGTEFSEKGDKRTCTAFREDEIVIKYLHPTHSEQLQSKLDSFTPGTTNFVPQNRLVRSTKHSLGSLCPSFANCRNLTDVHKMPDADPLSYLP